MKMFHFKCKGYGEEATVLAKTLIEARLSVLAGKRPMPEGVEPKPGGTDREREAWGIAYNNAMIDDVLGADYTVEEYGPGEVLWTEVS